MPRNADLIKRLLIKVIGYYTFFRRSGAVRNADRKCKAKTNLVSACGQNLGEYTANRTYRAWDKNRTKNGRTEWLCTNLANSFGCFGRKNDKRKETRKGKNATLTLLCRSHLPVATLIGD